MKNLLSATLPALALLALGGCATTGALSSTENDGVYYSSKDRTTAVAGTRAAGYQNDGYGTNTGSAQATTPPTDDNANPDYQGGTAQSGTAANGTDYYDDSYSSGAPSAFGQPYTGPGVSSTNYSPTWSVAPSFYGSPFGYGAGLSFGYGMGGFGGYSPLGFGGYPYGGFYDPFFSPFGYGAGLGFGLGYGGFGGFGSPFGYGYSPYAYGYPYGGGGYYGDVYGGYRGAYGYSRPVIYANGTRSAAGANPVLVGPRGGRGGAVMNNAAGAYPTSAAGNPNAVNIGGGRRAAINPAYNTPAGNAATGQPTNAPTYGRGGRAATFGGGEMVGQPATAAGSTNGQPTTTSPVPTQNMGGRRGFFNSVFGGGANSGSVNNNTGSVNNNPQPMQRRSYNQGGYSQPNYNQQRSYSQPTYSQPTYSQPQRSFGGGSFGGGGGGGNSGGGGGGGGGRRR